MRATGIRRFSLCSFDFRPPVPAKSRNSDHLWKSPDPLCGAVSVGRGRQSDPRPLSCYNFDPLVHLPLSAVLNLLDSAHRLHAFDTPASAVRGGLLPSGHQRGHTATHRLLRRASPCLQRRNFCVLPSCPLHFQSAQLVLLMSIQHLMERTDGVEQTRRILSCCA